ncbi:hypothetical protein [Paenibacillus aceti]|uniref:DUF3993 domain-containing protein n=1 Tax=Paenibacillus aceti TaxID=1820010 RepID=A0ABQ1VS27_9BACL|nr:hypothetical protein [Paenibacillus aceti]GGF94365.1 hypothetical protein GCM10010913_14840 [Paenibacillus aceti]
MSNPLSKIMAALLAVALLLLFPAVQAAEREEDIAVLAAYNTMVQFTDAVRNKGYLSAGMYEDFMRDLAVSGRIYEVELEHRYKKYHPEYRDPADSTSFQDRFSVVYDSYYTSDLLSRLFPDSVPESDGVQQSADRLYKLETGDFFSVSLTRRSVTPYEILSGFLYAGSALGRSQQVLLYGGMVLNEDH